MLPDPVQSPTEDAVISIGVLAERVGLSVSAVRKVENEGLILAHRGEGGRRLFCHDDIARIRHIQHLIQDPGLNIEGIRRLQGARPLLGAAAVRPRDAHAVPGLHRADPSVLGHQGARVCPPGKRLPPVRGVSAGIAWHG